MCGTIKPIKPMTPPAATTTPVTNDTTMMVVRLTRRTSTPRLVAVSSPCESRLYARDMNMKKHDPTTDPIKGMAILFQRALVRLPIVHEVILRTV